MRPFGGPLGGAVGRGATERAEGLRVLRKSATTLAGDHASQRGKERVSGQGRARCGPGKPSGSLSPEFPPLPLPFQAPPLPFSRLSPLPFFPVFDPRLGKTSRLVEPFRPSLPHWVTQSRWWLALARGRVPGALMCNIQTALKRDGSFSSMTDAIIVLSPPRRPTNDRL